MSWITLQILDNSLTAPEQDSLDLRVQPSSLVRTEEIQDRVTYLLSLGFSESFVNRLQRSENTLYHKEFIYQKFEELRNLGFKDPIKMVTSFPAVLELNIESIKKKIEELRNLGFGDPIKIITSSSTILNYNIKNIEKKIEELKNLGFGDPIKMVTSFPAVLELNIEKNIQPKVEILFYFITKYKLPYTSIQLMEYNNLFFSSKRDKLWILIHILCSKSWSDLDSISKVSTLLSQNLECVILAHNNNPNITTLAELITLSKEFKKNELTPNQLRREVEVLLKSSPDDKVLKRYARGYLKN